MVIYVLLSVLSVDRKDGLDLFAFGSNRLHKCDTQIVTENEQNEDGKKERNFF